MGVDYYGDFVVGVLLQKKEFSTTKQVPICEHNTENFPFCPTCGKKRGTKSVVLRPDWVGEGLLEDFDVVLGTDDAYVIVGKRLMNSFDLGRGHAQGAVRVPQPGMVLETFEAQVRKAIGTQAGEFGYWFSLFVSY